jgi:hypothetical protein
MTFADHVVMGAPGSRKKVHLIMTVRALSAIARGEAARQRSIGARLSALCIDQVPLERSAPDPAATPGFHHSQWQTEAESLQFPVDVRVNDWVS